MAQLAIGIAGAAIGSAFGPLGTSIGWAVGAAVGGLLFPEKQQGPRLQDLRLQRSTYGGMLPLVWGTVRVAGNVIDQTDLTEHEEKSGGKGGPEITNYTYSASFAIALCEGPIVGVRRAWADGRLVYDTTQGSEENNDPRFPFVLYLGTETQLPDPTLETIHGVGNIPAYLGTAYAVFTDFMLTDFSNRIPNIEFEVLTQEPPATPITPVKLRIFDDTDWGGYDAILQWPLTGGVIRAGLRTTVESPTDLQPSAIATFDADTLEYIEPSVPDAGDYWPQKIQNFLDNEGDVEIRYSPLTRYIGAEYVHNVWTWDTPQTTNPVVATDDLNVEIYPPVGQDVRFTLWDAIDWDEHSLEAAITSQNGVRLFVFTNDGSALTGHATHWYEFIADELTRQGTVDPALLVNGMRDRVAFGVMAASFENNGTYLWVHQANGNFEGHSGGQISLYQIDGSNNLAQAAPTISADELDVGAIEITLGNQRSSGVVIQTGYFGIVVGNALAVFRRIGDVAGVPLSRIVGDISEMAGFDPADFDVDELTEIVDGYIIADHGTARAGIEPLQNAYFFDGAEIDDVVRFAHRGKASIASITDDELAAHLNGSEPPPLLSLVRQQEVELPKRIEYSYLNNEADYQVGTQSAERQATTSDQVIGINVPIAMTSDKAKAAAHTLLAELWLRREKMVAYVSRRYAKLTPIDVISARGRTLAIRGTTETPEGVIKLDLEPSLRHIYAGGAKSAPAAEMRSVTGPIGSTLGRSPTAALLLDIPLVNDSDDPEGIYAALYPTNTDTWGGATLQKSVDAGTSYNVAAVVSTAAVVGETEDALGVYYGGNTVDELNSVTVLLTTGELSGTNNTGLLNGQNVALVGLEIIGFRDAELVAANTYTLTGLLRGRRGTEWAMDGHEADERFVLMPAADVDLLLGELNQERLYKSVTSGNTLASATAQAFTNRGARLKPYAPVLLGGGADASGNVTLNWTRRTRIGGAWFDNVDAPLSEASEAYVVEIWDASYTYCARIIEVAAQTASYSAADQMADFGATQATVYFTVGQIGSIGIGTRARGAASGTGADDDAVLSPIPPYSSGPLNPPPTGTVNGTLVWSPTAPHYTSGYQVGATYVVQFTAGATTTATIFCAEYGDPPRYRHLRICSDSAGANVMNEGFGNTASATVNVSNGVTYYAVITCELPGGAGLSGSPGDNADMIIQLNHP